jgi:hypothetical protein
MSLLEVDRGKSASSVALNYADGEKIFERLLVGEDIPRASFAPIYNVI